MYRLTVFPGKFSSQVKLNSSEPYNYIGREPILHFGVPMMNTQRLVLTLQELTKHDFKVHIALTVGGQKSPMKSSNYTLDLNNIDLNNPENTTQLITLKDENQLLSEKQEKLGTTRETTLTSILGDQY